MAVCEHFLITFCKEIDWATSLSHFVFLFSSFRLRLLHPSRNTKSWLHLACFTASFVAVCPCLGARNNLRVIESLANGSKRHNWLKSGNFWQKWQEWDPATGKMVATIIEIETGDSTQAPQAGPKLIYFYLNPAWFDICMIAKQGYVCLTCFTFALLLHAHRAIQAPPPPQIPPQANCHGQ